MVERGGGDMEPCSPTGTANLPEIGTNQADHERTNDAEPPKTTDCTDHLPAYSDEYSYMEAFLPFCQLTANRRAIEQG